MDDWVVAHRNGDRMKANTQRFREWVNARHGLALDGYDALWRWSVADIGTFWQAQPGE